MSGIPSVTDSAGAGPDFRSKLKKTLAQQGAATLDRLPPHSEECEQGVLGCCLLMPIESLTQCISRIKTPEAFYNLRHGVVYESMMQMFDAREAIDLITVQQHLKNRKLLDQIGGITYLSQLQDAVPSAANLSYYLDHVCEKYLLRQMIQICSGVVGRIFDYEGEVETLLTEVERTILSIRPNQTKKGLGMKELAQEALLLIEHLYTSKGAISGLSTGLPDLDKATDGMHKGEFIVLAAFPSAGKTALALNIGVHNALKNIPVGVASLEMQPAELTVRAICAEARINLFDVRDGRVTESDFTSISSSSGKISKMPMYIENCNGKTISEIAATFRRMHQEHSIQLGIIDYIQLVTCPGCSNREQEVSAVSKGIKAISMELDIPILALSQLNDDGRLRESRAIGQDGNSVWKLELDGEKVPQNQPIKLLVDKNRAGPAGIIVPLLFQKQFTRFASAVAQTISPEDVPTNKRK